MLLVQILDRVYSFNFKWLCSDVSCHAYTAFDSVQKAIIVAFRGTDTDAQLWEEFESFLQLALWFLSLIKFRKKEPFFDNGHVYKYFYDAFILLWHQGLENSIRNLKFLYPSYDVWVWLFKS